MTPRLEPPEKYTGNIKVWVDEAIWGHRFYNDQTPWLIFLEFLGIFRFRMSQRQALDGNMPDGKHETFSYKIPRLIRPRRLIFDNPYIPHVNETKTQDSGSWASWLDAFSNGEDYSYLRERFGSFTDFANVIEFFRSTSVESHRERRSSSRFLFPYGPDCLYADLPTRMKASPDRRFFARGGELLYLMLNRSGRGPEIANKISNQLLRGDDPWNRAVKALLPDDDVEASPALSTIGYLPYAERPEYAALADTWLKLLRLDLRGEALFDPLVRLSALHMLLYMLRRGQEEVSGSREPEEPKIVLEIASPRRTGMFELSTENFHSNRMLSTRAVRAHIESAKQDERWSSALKARAPAEAVREFLRQRFRWSPDDGHLSNNHDLTFDALLNDAENRHRQHVGRVHLEWGQRLGLAVSRRGVGTWYSPDDSLLKALVMCTVDEGREEYHRFLAKLYDNFRLVIGASEAWRAYGSPLPIDQNAFRQNAQRLEQRLRALGLLRRLSDDCAYVENPFRSQP